MIRFAAGLLTALLTCLVLIAASPPEPGDDPAFDDRARALEQELRCVTCPGQAVADSQVPTAEAIRDYVRRRLAEGADEATIKRELVEIYGDEVLMRPPLNASTLALWGAPALIALLGALAVLSALRRGRS